MLRSMTAADFDAVRDVEVEAGRAFADIGMVAIAEDDPPSTSDLAAFVLDGRAWVAEVSDTVGAYLVARLVDGVEHVEQVSVRPSLRGRGLGAALIDHSAATTLTTFRDVPWNAPYYRRLGFAETTELGPELRELVAHEAVAIPGDWPRVAMRRVRCGPTGPVATMTWAR